jgi:hypothetical protein
MWRSLVWWRPCVFGDAQLVNQGFGLISGEPPAGLALVQPERMPGIAKVAVTRRADEAGKLLNLS